MTVLLAGTRADLDEDAGARVVGDQVELTLGAAPVPGHDAQPARLQQRHRELLGAQAEGGARRQR